MRLRITFSKTGSLRYTGHLDLQTVWERTARRAGLALAYTHGFHPGPKIQIASALPLGYAGRAEIVDIWLEADPGELTGASQRLQAAAPPGLTILKLEAVDEHGPALQTRVVSSEYCITLLEPIDRTKLKQDMENLLAGRSLPRERRGKPYDLRPLIESLSFSPPSTGGEMEQMQNVMLMMRLAARPGATGRPEEVLSALGIPVESTRIERTRLFLDSP